jgi:hypothetical protein
MTTSPDHTWIAREVVAWMKTQEGSFGYIRICKEIERRWELEGWGWPHPERDTDFIFRKVIHMLA